MNSNRIISHDVFFDWIWKNKQNRIVVLVFIALILLLFTIFKCLYPYPNFLPDSISYLDAAWSNAWINAWPIGYSKFLRFFSCITNSDTALILFQYLAIQLSILYSIFTILYFLFSGRRMLHFLWICLIIIQPLLFHISNLVSSDALFTAISLTWFTQLLWLSHQPTTKLILIHTVFLFLAFIFRYNALYYPFISIFSILLSLLSRQKKLIAIVLFLLFPTLFILGTVQQYKKITGIAQFSPFAGWQLASNTLYSYSFVKSKTPAELPIKFRHLHQLVNLHMDSIRRLARRPDSLPGIYYLWNENAPLKRYVKTLNDSSVSGFIKWSKISPLYSEYGIYLLKEYPEAFCRHYILPNLITYYLPPSEFLGLYNTGNEILNPISKRWFGYNIDKIQSSFQRKKISYIEIYRVLWVIANAIFVLGFAWYLWLTLNSKTKLYFSWVYGLSGVVWLCNFGFSVLAAPIVLRYQVFSLFLSITFGCLFIQFILQTHKLNYK